jgi:hypothetical protein
MVREPVKRERVFVVVAFKDVAKIFVVVREFDMNTFPITYRLV